MSQNLQARRAILNMQRHYDKGQMLFKEGEATSDLYILISGSVEVLRNGKVIATISDKGTFIGEMSTLLKTPRTATVRAAEDAMLFVVPDDAVEKFIAESPNIGIKLCQMLARRLQNTTEQFSNLKVDAAALEDCYVKLYETLLAQYQKRRSEDLQKILQEHTKMNSCIREKFLI